MEFEALTKSILGCAMNVHNTLGPGFLESVYAKALAYELNKLALVVEAERPVKVTYDGAVIGDFFVDLLVNQQIIIELKAVQNLAVAHEVQLVNYLKATGFDIGLLINFGAERLEFKRKHRQYKERAVPSSRAPLIASEYEFTRP